MAQASTGTRENTAEADVLPNLAPFGRHVRAANKSPRTIKAYSEAVRQFDGFLADRGMFGQSERSGPSTSRPSSSTSWSGFELPRLPTATAASSGSAEARRRGRDPRDADGEDAAAHRPGEPPTGSRCRTDAGKPHDGHGSTTCGALLGQEIAQREPPKLT